MEKTAATSPDTTRDSLIAGRGDTREHLAFGIVTLLALALSTALVHIVHGSGHLSEILWAWIANLGQAGLAFWINRVAIGAETTRFMLLGMGVNLLRVVLLLTLIVVVEKSGLGAFVPFLAAVLTGFVVFLCGEIFVLHTRSHHGLHVRGTAGRET